MRHLIMVFVTAGEDCDRGRPCFPVDCTVSPRPRLSQLCMLSVSSVRQIVNVRSCVHTRENRFQLPRINLTAASLRRSGQVHPTEPSRTYWTLNVLDHTNIASGLLYLALPIKSRPGPETAG